MNDLSRLSRIRLRKGRLTLRNSSRESKNFSEGDLEFARNKKDLPEVPKEAKKGLKFAFVKNTSEVLKIALNTNPNKTK